MYFNNYTVTLIQCLIQNNFERMHVECKLIFQTCFLFALSRFTSSQIRFDTSEADDGLHHGDVREGEGGEGAGEGREEDSVGGECASPKSNRTTDIR